MVWHLLLILLCPVCPMVARLLRDDRDRQILALRQQVLILQRQLWKRPRLARAERLAMLLLCVRMGQRQPLGCLMIVKRAAIVAWHRQILRRQWTFRPQRRPGRPKTGPQAE